MPSEQNRERARRGDWKAMEKKEGKSRGGERAVFMDVGKAAGWPVGRLARLGGR